jgi:hypothetical protein
MALDVSCNGDDNSVVVAVEQIRSAARRRKSDAI